MSSEGNGVKDDSGHTTNDRAISQPVQAESKDTRDTNNDVEDVIPFDISLDENDRPHRPTPNSSKHKWHEQQEPHKHQVKAHLHHHHVHHEKQPDHDTGKNHEYEDKHESKPNHNQLGHSHKAIHKGHPKEHTDDHQHQQHDAAHAHHKAGHSHPAKKQDSHHQEEQGLHVTGTKYPGSQHHAPDHTKAEHVHAHGHTGRESRGPGHAHEKHDKHNKHQVHHGDENLRDESNSHAHCTDGDHHVKHGSEYQDPRKTVKPSPHIPHGYAHQEMHSLSHQRAEHPQTHPYTHPHHQPHHPIRPVHQEQQEYGERPHVSREDSEPELPTHPHSDPHDVQHAQTDRSAHTGSHNATHTTHASHHNEMHSSGRDIHVEDWATANVSPTLRRKAPLPAIPITHDHIHLRQDPPASEEHHHYTEAVHTGPEHKHLDEKPYAVTTCSMHVERGGEKKECWITGFAVLSPDRVVVADYNNNRVKVISVERGETMSRIVLPTSPKDVTVVSDRTLAVTLPAMDVIQFITMEGQLPILDMGSAIKVKGYCNGIEHERGELYVSFTSPPKVEILSLKGEVLHSIANNYRGHPFFKTPQYLAIHNEAIYVSDSHNNAVIKVSRHGDVLGTYTDVDLKNPQGIVVTPSGQLLVCGQDTHNVHLVTSDCRTMSVFLDRKDGIWWPHVIGICPDTHTIYVSSTSGDIERDNFMRLYAFSDIKPLTSKLMGIHEH